MNVYFEAIETDDELTRENVAVESDPARLLAWLDEQEELAHELSVMCGTMKQVDSSRIVGMSRKLGYVRISINWIRKRLAELDVDAPDYIATKKEKRQARQLTEQAQSLTAAKLKNANLRAENERLRAKLKALRAQGIEAGTGETEGLDAKRESPVRQDAPDTPTQPPEPTP